MDALDDRPRRRARGASRGAAGRRYRGVHPSRDALVATIQKTGYGAELQQPDVSAFEEQEARCGGAVTFPEPRKYVKPIAYNVLPMAGTVVSQTAKQGQTLNANQQAPIVLRIADLDLGPALPHDRRIDGRRDAVAVDSHGPTPPR